MSFILGSKSWLVLSSESGELVFPTQPHVDPGPELPVQEHESTVTDLLNEAPTSKFHRRTVIISGVGFFTDAYDLFVIGTAAALVAVQWHLSTLQTSWVTRLSMNSRSDGSVSISQAGYLRR